MKLIESWGWNQIRSVQWVMTTDSCYHIAEDRIMDSPWKLVTLHLSCEWPRPHSFPAMAGTTWAAADGLMKPVSPSPKDLPHTGIKPISLVSPALIGWFFITSTTWEVEMCLHECWKEIHVCLGRTFYLWHPIIEWDSLCKCSDFSIVFAHFNSLDLSLKSKLTSSFPLQENDVFVDCEPES